jgi:DNA-binding IclR family transcriptional regulator
MESGVGRASVGDEAVRQMSRKQIAVAVAEVRENGLARAVERPIPGVNAFSAPVFDRSGTFDADWESPIAECSATIKVRTRIASFGNAASLSARSIAGCCAQQLMVMVLRMRSPPG